MDVAAAVAAAVVATATISVCLDAVYLALESVSTFAVAARTDAPVQIQY